MSTSTSRSTSKASARPGRCSAPGRYRSSTRPPAWSVPPSGGPSSTSTSPAANAPRAGRGRTGWCASWTGSTGARAPTRTWTSCSTSATTSSGARSARSATARSARWCPRSSTSGMSSSSTSSGAAARSTPPPPPPGPTEVSDHDGRVADLGRRHASRSQRSAREGGHEVTVPDTGALAPVEQRVTVTIDGFEISVPKGVLVIRAAELLGIQIPRFCDHPLLDPVGACRQCLVEVEGQAKPLASCTTTCTDGMTVRTQLTSRVAEKAQRGVMEFLLINHPLDCPMCDKGGECPLQNQAMSNGRGESRFAETKRTFAKPVALSSEVLLDRERCVSCARCTRFAEQIAGDPLIELLERGPNQQVGTADGVPFDSYFSGNTVQICPVGALTGAAYRFRARPYDLVSTPSICEHCAAGCRQRTDHRRGAVTRWLAGNDPQVNEEWNCDKGRWAFTYATQPDRLVTPLVRYE